MTGAPAAAAGGCRGDGRWCQELPGDEVSASGGPRWYEIRVAGTAGVLDSRWAAWFDGLQVSGHSKETVIFGLLTD